MSEETGGVGESSLRNQTIAQLKELNKEAKEIRLMGDILGAMFDSAANGEGDEEAAKKGFDMAIQNQSCNNFMQFVRESGYEKGIKQGAKKGFFIGYTVGVVATLVIISIIKALF